MSRSDALTHRPWRRLLTRSVGAARGVPTMLSTEEQKLYFWLTAFWAEGVGEIVDLGCFAGGSTARLAEGHRAATLPSGIHAFDRFTADDDVKRRVLYPQGVAPFDVRDILPLARNLLEPWAPRVTFHRGEIEQAVWTGLPIEILVIDAAKTAASCDAIAGTFFPHLLSGRSLVVHQDFLHWSQPWIPAQMEALFAFFRPVAYAPRDTMVFLCQATPDARALSEAETAAMDDPALDLALADAERRYRSCGLGRRVAAMRQALSANPSLRRAHQFRKP